MQEPRFTHRTLRCLLVALLALAPGGCALEPGPGRSPRGGAPAEPYPLGPEMVLLERDSLSEEYRKLLHSESSNLNVLNAEWRRVEVPDNADSFARAHGGIARVEADPALRAAHQRRRAIQEQFLSILRAEYAARGKKAPFDEGPAGEAEEVAPSAKADPGLSIEPILPAPGAEKEWPRWRGPSGQGISLETGLPLRWSASEGIAWRAEIPGSGNSSPVIWGDRIFLTTAFEEGKRRSLVCLRRSDGELLYVQDAPSAPPEGRVIRKNGYASATPAVDGERVVTFFGNAGIACFDLEGRLLWRHPLPPFDAMHGTGASPAICGELVLLFQEQSSKGSLAVAVDRRTGEKRWAKEMPAALGWCTPLPLRVAGMEQVVWGASKALLALDPRNGDELWRVRGPTHEVIPSVAYGHGLIYSVSGRVGPTLAIRPVGAGDITATALAWRAPRGAPHVPSPVLWDGRLYQVSDMGIATCFEAPTGRVLWQRRLGGKFSASPVAGDGKIYFTSEEGDTTVLRAGPEFEVLSVNPLGEYTLASAAVLGGRIYIRTEKALHAIGSPRAASAASADSTAR